MDVRPSCGREDEGQQGEGEGEGEGRAYEHRVLADEGYACGT